MKTSVLSLPHQTIPKIPLKLTLSVMNAACAGKPLYCIVQRATPKYFSALAEIGKTDPDFQYAFIKAQLSEFHITPILGEFRTLKAAKRNFNITNPLDFEATIYEYSVEEVRAACASCFLQRDFKDS